MPMTESTAQPRIASANPEGQGSLFAHLKNRAAGTGPSRDQKRSRPEISAARLSAGQGGLSVVQICTPRGRSARFNFPLPAPELFLGGGESV